LTRQNADDDRTPEAEEAVAAGHPRSVGELPAAQAARRKRHQSWTEEMKHHYATAKAQAKREARAADAAKWTALEVGGYQRDVCGVDLRLWVSEDGNWSITSKMDLDQSIAVGSAGTVEQAQADAADAAMDQVSVMTSALSPRPRKRKKIEPNASENLRETVQGLRLAISDLLPTKPAAIRRPKRESSQQ
ncbi:hypothetical protein, partial [Rhodococcus sp. NPDC058514]|uniref:hypothetical protein n=1 Tax=Rhodococcus sp. NPDC058514 TaxID=3346532 RepID=UPI00366082BF